MGQFQHINELFEAMLEYYNQQDWAGALTLIEREAAQFPDSWNQTHYWKICMLGRLGQVDEAVSLLEEVIEAGYWYSERRLRDDPDLTSLQGDPRYEALVLRSIRRAAERQATVEPAMTVIRPDGPGPFPVLIALHGNSSNPELTAPYWRSATDHGWLVVVPQSTQSADPDRYNWDDIELSTKDVLSYTEQLTAEYPVDMSQIVLGGFSRGAMLACHLALKWVLDVQGLIMVAPSIRDVQPWKSEAEMAARQGLWTSIIIGERDTLFYPHAVELHQLLQQHGVPSMLKVYPEMAHAYPLDFADVLGNILSRF